MFEEMSNVKTNRKVKLLLIVGVGRSGTSLLQSILGSHSKIDMLPETSFVRRFVLNGRVNSLNGEQAKRVIQSDERLGDDFLEALETSRGEAWSAKNVYLSVLRKRAERVEIVGDKDPKLVEYLPAVYRKIEPYRIIHVIRDPRDVLASKMNADWSRDRWWPLHVFANRVQYNIGVRDGPRLFGRRYLEVMYEDLVSNSDSVIQRVCDFLEVDYESEMLQKFPETAQGLVRDDEFQWKKETMGPILERNPGKWKNALTAFQVAVCETACSNTMKGRYAFSEPYATMGPFRQMILSTVNPLLSILETIYSLWLNRKN